MPAPNRPFQVKSRAASVAILFALAAFSAAVFMYWPIHEVRATGQSFYSLKGAVLVPIFLYYGILLLCGFDHTIPIRETREGGKRKFTRRGWILIGSTIVVGILGYQAWIAYLHAIGITADF